MPRAIAFILVWASLVAPAFAQLRPSSQPTTQETLTLLRIQQARQLQALRLQQQVSQQARLRNQILSAQRSPLFCPPPTDYDRIVDSLEWMTATSGAIVIARFDFIFLDSPNYCWARVHADEVLKGDAPPSSFRLRCDGISNIQVQAWMTNKTPVLLFITHFTKDEFSISPTLANDWHFAAIPLDQPAYAVTLDPATLTDPTQIVAATRKAIAAKETANSILLIPGNIVPPNGPGQVTGAATEIIRLAAPRDTWLDQTAPRWLASSDPDLRITAIENLIVHPPGADRANQMLAPLLNDPYAKPRPLLATRGVTYPVRERAYHALRLAGVAVPVPIVESPSVAFRIVRLLLIPMSLLLTLFIWRVYRCKKRNRPLPIPMPTTLFFGLINTLFLITALLWAAAHFNITINLNLGQGTMHEIRLHNSELVATTFDNWPYRISKVTLTNQPPLKSSPYTLDIASDYHWGPVKTSVGAVTNWTELTPPPSTFMEQTFPLMIALAPLTAIVALRVTWRIHTRRKARRQPGQCPICGYDLRATPNRCPECGTAVRTAPTIA